MKRFGNALLSLAAPLLILLAIIGLFQRKGSDKIHTIPALVVGGGLIISGAVSRRRRRSKLLNAILETNNELD